MKLKKISIRAAIIMAAALSAAALGACSGSASKSDKADVRQDDRKGGGPGGPQLGRPGGGPTIDKSGDATLQAMIKKIVPEFRQLVYEDSVTGKSLKYNLFTPADSDRAAAYPLVLFIADASTPGDSFTTPLTQGYGALVWATPEWQAATPCYVLVPQLSGVGVNDAYEHTDEVDMVVRLVRQLASTHNIDYNRLYTTGQSMGGMMSMYYNITYPDLFAASLFVDCHWDKSKFDELARHTFTYVTAGTSGHSWGCIKPLEEAVVKDGRRYEYAQWSARLPQAEQDSLAAAMLAKGAPVNIINFTAGSVLPADGKGSEHMYSFDYAYRLTPVLQWIFRQSKK